MIDGIMAYGRLLETNRGKPQPRRHKCASCGVIFECKACTKVMKAAFVRTDEGLYARSCYVAGPQKDAAGFFNFNCNACR